MTYKHRDRAFSLTEVLLAVGALAIGMLFIAGTFLTGIYLTAITAERTTAAVVADEAFAKIKLYGVNVDSGDPNRVVAFFRPFEEVAARGPVPAEEFAYPSTPVDISEKQYYWSALCRRIYSYPASRLVQVVVFVTRKTASAASYQGGAGRPIPMRVLISATAVSNVLEMRIPTSKTWVNDGCTIVDDETGQIYRVLQRRDAGPGAFPGATIELDRPWEGRLAATIWVVPPPIGGGRDPCIAVYQKVIRF